MAERRKIVIETGEGTSEPLPTPHSDAEATLTARPVVPLNDQEPHQMPYGDYAGRAPKPFWRRPALIVGIVLAAIGVGLAAGLAIGIYRNRNAAETPAANAPAATVENTNLSQTVEPTPQESVATVPDQPEEEPVVEPKEDAVEPKEEERERTTARSERRDDDDDVSQPVVAKPPVARDKKPIKIDEYTVEGERAEREARREQRREERRAERRERRRRRDDNEINLPRGIQRAGREVDRIREIFEGRQP
jgi:hypothetical protein